MKKTRVRKIIQDWDQLIKTKDPFILKHCAPELRLNEDAVILCLKRSGINMQYASEKFKDKRSLAVIAGFEGYPHLSTRLRSDKDLFMEIAKKHKNIRFSHFMHAGDNIKCDEELFSLIFDTSPSEIKWAGDNIKSDLKWGIKVAKRYYHGIVYLSSELRKNEEIFKLALEEQEKQKLFISNNFLSYFLSPLTSNKELVLQVIKQKPSSFQFASTILRGDCQFLLKAIEIAPNCWSYATDKLRKDKEKRLPHGTVIEYLNIMNMHKALKEKLIINVNSPVNNKRKVKI